MSRILLSYIGYPVGAGKFFKKALRNLGHEVVHFGPDAKGLLPWRPNTDFSKYADTPDIPMPYPFSRTFPLSSAMQLAGGNFDLVIQMDANFHLLGKPNCPNVVWMIDNHVTDYKESVAEASVIFGAHSWGHQSTDPRFVWLPCAYSPSDHYQTESPKHYDLMFLGVIYGHRASLLEKLQQCGGNVSWGMGLLGEEYNALYNRSRMGLCYSACGDLPMRVFENAAQGLMIFCDRQTDLTRLGLRDGTHYIGFGSEDEAVEKFKALLKTPLLVEQITKAGQAALKNETYESRAEAMFGYL